MSYITEPDPFEPADVDWQPVAPQLATVRLIGLACWAGPVIIALVVVCAIWPFVWLIAGAVVITALCVWQACLIPRRVRAMQYAVRDRDLFWRHGIMVRHLSVVPYVRIQYVDIHVGPIERAFGLSSLSVSTAAMALAAVVIGITPATAAQLRDILTNRDKLTGGPATQTSPTPWPDDNSTEPSPAPHLAPCPDSDNATTPLAPHPYLRPGDPT